jgi:hypothetical protein
MPDQAVPTGHPRSRLRLAVVAFVTTAAPVGLYFITRPYVRTDTAALAIAAAVPALATVIVAVWRREARLLALLTAVAVGAALTVTAVSGGDALPLKLYRPAITAVLGVAAVISVAMDRPLLVPVIRVAVRRKGWKLSLPHRKVKVLTMIAGVGLLVEAAATVVLAFELSTGAYLVAVRVVRVVVVVTCLAVMTWRARK